MRTRCYDVSILQKHGAKIQILCRRKLVSSFLMGKWMSRICIAFSRSQRRFNVRSWTKTQGSGCMSSSVSSPDWQLSPASRILLSYEIGQVASTVWCAISHRIQNLDPGLQITFQWQFKARTTAVHFFHVSNVNKVLYLVATVLESSKPTMNAIVMFWLPGSYILVRKEKTMRKTNVIAKYCNEWCTKNKG